MRNYLLSLYGKLYFSLGEETVPEKHIHAFNAEVATYGYTLDGDLMQKLRRATDFDQMRKEVISVLTVLTGTSAQYRHRTLFRNFPYEVPEQRNYLFQRILGYVQNDFGYLPNDGDLLSCGHIIDSRIFNLQDFGGCPICQHAVPELDSPDVARYDFKRVTPLRVISYAGDETLRQIGNSLLSRNSSLSQDEKTLLREINGKMQLDMPSKIFKETLPILFEMGFDVSEHLSGATDVLRIAAYVSDRNADLSLAKPVRFKLTKSHKKRMLRMLEGLDTLLVEDLLRHRERWLRLGEKLNPGTQENRKRYPKVAEAFDLIRNHPKEIWTFSRAVEQKIRAGKVDDALMTTLAKRPGEFFRRLDFMLRSTTHHDAIQDHLLKVLPRAQTKMLFEIEKYLRHRATTLDFERVFFPKGSFNKIKIIPENRASIPDHVIQDCIEAISNELAKRFANKEPMGRVYVDEALKGVIVPFNRRGDSSTAVPVMKGSRYPFSPDAEVVRLFVYWKGRDVDLSVLYYDDAFQPRGHVAFTNLYDDHVSIVHSGDIQYAPKGASEFIDFSINSMIAAGIRYVAASVISFSGEPFSSFPCFAGFMERDAIKSGKKYEPKSVKLKFDLNYQTTKCMPMIFDTHERQFIFTDLALREGSYQFVRGTEKHSAALLRAIVRMPEYKPTFYDLIAENVAVRGTRVFDPNEADIVFTPDTLDVDKVLADCLG